MSHNKAITIAMVAKQARVSISSVSRYLNRSAKLKQDKQQRIAATIQKMGYVPNPIAQGLVRGKTYTIGVLTQFIDSPFFGEMLRGIEEGLIEANYLPLYAGGLAVRERELKQIQSLLARKIDGLIILNGNLHQDDFLELSEKVPLVIVGRNLQTPSIISIDFDNFNAAGIAVQHLCDLKHKQIAYIAGPVDNRDSIERLRGFRRQMQQCQLAVNEDLIVSGDFQETGGYQAMQSLTHRGLPFTAMVIANDQMAYGALWAANKAGLRVPDDISVVGFDDLPHSAYTCPPLTSIRYSVGKMGRYAADAMVARLQGRVIQHQVFSARLKIRESTRQNSL